MKNEPQNLSEYPEYTAPDGSEVRLLPDMPGGCLCPFTLHPRTTSIPVSHKKVDEIWFYIKGEGKVCHQLGSEESIVAVQEGVSLTIPVGTSFQFRITGVTPPRFLCFTLPPWPGKDATIMLDKEGLAWI